MGASTKSVHHLSYCLMGFTILLAFAMLDLAAVAIPAMVVSLPQVFAVAAAFTLISSGGVFTVWNIEAAFAPKRAEAVPMHRATR